MLRWATVILIGVVLRAAMLPSPVVANGDAETARPNIIFIMADDLGYGDLGCYGQQRIATPHIDRLAAEGMLFTQAYAGGCVCTPSRSCLMTGMHGGHTAARDNIPHYHTYLQEEDVTVAEVLRDAGYRCGGVGKWSLGDAGTVGRATNQGFESWFGYLNQDHAHYYYPEYLDDDEGRLELQGNGKSRAHYSHDLLTERALDFVRTRRDGPFFLYAAYTIPHFSSPKEDATRLPVPSDEPYSDRPWNQQAKNYAAMVTRLDRDVGRIVSQVDALGLREHTLIIFTSDHGPWGGMPQLFGSSGPLRGEKRELYEGGIRVPFIARWPGEVAAGVRSDAVIAFWDMLPTFADLAGAAKPEAIDGVSVAAALGGRPLAKTHDYLYWDYGHNREVYHQAVRVGDWKAVRHGVGSPLELYDLSRDLSESNDVADSHPQIINQMALVMREAVVPSPRYQVGRPYTGQKIWRPAAD